MGSLVRHTVGGIWNVVFIEIVVDRRMGVWVVKVEGVRRRMHREGIEGIFTWKIVMKVGKVMMVVLSVLRIAFIHH